MLKRSCSLVIGFTVSLALISGANAQETRDPLTRFLHGLFNRDTPAPRAPAEEPPRTPPVQAVPPAEPPIPKARPATAPGERKQPDTGLRTTAPTAPRAVPTGAAARPAPAQARPVPEPKKDAAAAVPAAVPAPPPPVPTTRQAAVERVNAYFNSIDRMTASFVQTSANGRSEGTLFLQRPGQLRFAYAPPSTLEIVSDGRHVAVRDKKLGTNDVYPIGQTPLKFLLQDQFDLGRDTKIQDVQINPDGIVTVRFDDSATFGGTSKVTLRFDAKANRLMQWNVTDPQGFETTVVLSGVEVVKRQRGGS